MTIASNFKDNLLRKILYFDSLVFFLSKISLVEYQFFPYVNLINQRQAGTLSQSLTK